MLRKIKIRWLFSLVILKISKGFKGIGYLNLLQKFCVKDGMIWYLNNKFKLLEGKKKWKGLLLKYKKLLAPFRFRKNHLLWSVRIWKLQKKYRGKKCLEMLPPVSVPNIKNKRTRLRKFWWRKKRNRRRKGSMLN